jgi:threonine synthase
MSIKYISTRGKGNSLTASQAIIQGLATDGGLLVPDKVPSIKDELPTLTGKSYREISMKTLGAFFDDFTESEIEDCVLKAYDDKFSDNRIIPIVKAGDAYFLELFYGKTAAFKDMALSILPHLMTKALAKQGEHKTVCILTATSGDTGKAALEGFADVSGTRIIVFYPEDGVSPMQKAQMTTQEGKNVNVFGIKGNFDDAQRAVKDIFSDEDLVTRLAGKDIRLSSANSINIGRLVPQIAYYIYGYSELVRSGEIDAGDRINIVVPTGNFGNILAAWYAAKMGIPVNRFICASNQNKVLTDFIRTGIYDARREFFLTDSPSMDILISSNLERLLYHLSDGNSSDISLFMEKLKNEGNYTITERIKKGMSSFYGGFSDMEDTKRAISYLYKQSSYLVDTHTAVAYNVYKNYREETGDLTPALIASTASAYKFPKSVLKALGREPASDDFDCIDILKKETGVRIPSGLKNLRDKRIYHGEVIEKDKMEETIEAVL